MLHKVSEIPFQNVIQALLDESKPLPPLYLYRFSDMPNKDLLALKKTWPKVALWRRRALLEDLHELGDSDTVLAFDGVSLLGLQDEDPQVRLVAVHILDDYEDTSLEPVFQKMAAEDSDTDVRAAAISALGVYVYLGELEEFPEADLHSLVDFLLGIARGSDVELVRRRALEALGYSSREEVPVLIEKAYRSHNAEWIVSALLTMGHSANEHWNSQVVAMLDNSRPAIRAEAVAAAGELAIQEAAPTLLGLLEDDDDDVRAAAIWSLSQIGGEGVREALENMLEDCDDDDLTDLLENAIDNLSFTEEMGLFSLIDLGEDELDDDEEDHIGKGAKN